MLIYYINNFPGSGNGACMDVLRYCQFRNRRQCNTEYMKKGCCITCRGLFNINAELNML